MKELISNGLYALYDEERSAFVQIKETKESDVNYVLTPEEFPEYDVTKSRYMGHVFLEIQMGEKRLTLDTGSSKAYRQISIDEEKIVVRYSGMAGETECCQALQLEQIFTVAESGIRWQISLSNTGDEAFEVKSLGMPLLMNQYFRKDSAFKYEQCVLRHASIMNHHSYIYWNKSSGKGPILLIQAVDDTPMVHAACEKENPIFGEKGTMHEAYEGSYIVYPVHEKTMFSQFDTSSIVMEPGSKNEYAFYLGMVDNLEEMDRQLVHNGGLQVKCLPGMCVPINEEITMVIQGNQEPEVVLQENEDQCLLITAFEAGYRAVIRLGGYGVRQVTLRCGNEETYIQLFGMEPIREIIQKQADFIAKNQYETNPEDPCYHGLLMWDMYLKHRINASYNPHGPDWFAGGSDEIGLVSGLFLSGKNIYMPNEEQLKVLQGYIHDFIEDRLTEQPGYRVHRMVPWYKMFEPWAGYGADDVWRAFNYVHVINTYYNMYRIATTYGYEFLDKPSYYILQAYHYTKAMFHYWMFPDGVGATEFANMGEVHIALDLADALRAEGYIDEARWVDTTVRRKADFFASQAFPYGSEMPYDSTAFEAVYAYGKAIDDGRVMEMTKDVVCANRGQQPVWFLYQTDVRQMGDSYWNVSYMTQLGALPIYDWIMEEEKESVDLVEQWYGSYLAGWSIYNSGGYWSDDPSNEGASGWVVKNSEGRYTGQKGNSYYLKGIVPMSGESALGFYGGLHIAAAMVVEHPVMGTYGFGCHVETRADGHYIELTDGLGVHLVNRIDGWSLKVNRDRMLSVEAREGKLLVTLENYTGDAHEVTLTLEYKGEIEEINVALREEGSHCVEVVLA